MIGDAVMMSEMSNGFTREGYHLLGFSADPEDKEPQTGVEGSLVINEALLRRLYQGVEGRRAPGTMYAIWARDINVLTCGIRPVGATLTCEKEKKSCVVWDISGLYQLRVRTDEEEDISTFVPRPCNCGKPCFKPCSEDCDEYFRSSCPKRGDDYFCGV